MVFENRNLSTISLGTHQKPLFLVMNHTSFHHAFMCQPGFGSDEQGGLSQAKTERGERGRRGRTFAPDVHLHLHKMTIWGRWG
jgi:hypothetical protein